MKIAVSEKAVREYIKEMLSPNPTGWQSTGDLSTAPVNVSSVVDPSAAVTDPDNPNFTPSNRSELLSSISSLVSGISDDEAGDVYEKLKKTLNHPEEGEKMPTKKTDKKVEEAIRHAVRKMLRESGQYVNAGGVSTSGWETGTPKGQIECPDCDGRGHIGGMVCDTCKGESYIDAPKKRGYEMAGEGEATFDEIAKEFGFAGPPGARQAIQRILEKAKFIIDMPPDEWDIFVLSAMSDFIEFMRNPPPGTGPRALDDEDIEELKKDPVGVANMTLFRNFLGKKIDKARRKDQKIIDIRK